MVELRPVTMRVPVPPDAEPMSMPSVVSVTISEALLETVA